VINDGMLYDPIQGHSQDHGGPKVVKMADFEVYLLASVHVIRMLMVKFIIIPDNIQILCTLIFDIHLCSV